jgi:hypothetical protein
MRSFIKAVKLGTQKARMSKLGQSVSRAAVMAAPTRSYPAEIIPTIEQTGWDESILRRRGFQWI